MLKRGLMLFLAVVTMTSAGTLGGMLMATSECHAALYRDIYGELHYRPLRSTRTTWNFGKNPIRPVHEIMDMTEEEFDVWCRSGN